jgi:hypothetical protein
VKTDRYGRDLQYFQIALTQYLRELADWDHDVAQGIQKKSPLIRASYVENINYCRRMIQELE